MCKDLQTFLVETILSFLFWLRREDWQLPIIEQLVYQTDKNSHQSVL